MIYAFLILLLVIFFIYGYTKLIKLHDELRLITPQLHRVQDYLTHQAVKIARLERELNALNENSQELYDHIRKKKSPERLNGND